MRWPALLASILLAARALGQDPADPALIYGPRREFAGLYATNFEISYFVECDPAADDCANWLERDLHWASGATAEIERLFQACIARWNGSRDRWALFAIRFVGREMLDRRPRASPYDTARRVVLDAPPFLDLIGTDETVARDLPLYRRRPTIRCAG